MATARTADWWQASPPGGRDAVLAGAGLRGDSGNGPWCAVGDAPVRPVAGARHRHARAVRDTPCG